LLAWSYVLTHKASQQNAWIAYIGVTVSACAIIAMFLADLILFGGNTAVDLQKQIVIFRLQATLYEAVCWGVTLIMGGLVATHISCSLLFHVLDPNVRSGIAQRGVDYERETQKHQLARVELQVGKHLTVESAKHIKAAIETAAPDFAAQMVERAVPAMLARANDNMEEVLGSDYLPRRQVRKLPNANIPPADGNIADQLFDGVKVEREQSLQDNFDSPVNVNEITVQETADKQEVTAHPTQAS